MISNYFNYNYNFEDIIKNDPSKMAIDNYWYLHSSPSTTQWCWNSDIFTDKQIENIIVLGKRLGVKRSETGGEGENCLHVRRSFTSWIAPNPETSWIFKTLTDVALANNQKYWNFDLEKIEKLQFTQYLSEENGTYHAHIDPMDWSMPHNRKLSMSLQLSDPKDYEGGELKLHTSVNPTIISKQKGMMVFFPSYTLHEVTPVTKGERYSLVAWFHGPNMR